MTTENKIVHIFRHGEVGRDPNVIDPSLTERGFLDAINLINKLPPSMKAPTLVLVSPLKRCIQTALFAFHPRFNFHLQDKAKENNDCSEVIRHFLYENITFMLDPRLQEIGQSYETGNRNKMPSRQEMNPIFKEFLVFPEEFYPKYTDGQDSDPDKDQDWYNEKGLWAGRLSSVNTLERAASFKEFLYNRPEKEIIVVTSNAFIDTLVHDPQTQINYLESRSCVWKPTISGRMRLVPDTFPEFKRDVVPDEDYFEFWQYRRYRLSERSELFNKWYRKPSKIYESLLRFEVCKKYLGLDEINLAEVKAELGPDIVEQVKSKVEERMKNGRLFSICL